MREHKRTSSRNGTSQSGWQSGFAALSGWQQQSKELQVSPIVSVYCSRVEHREWRNSVPRGWLGTLEAFGAYLELPVPWELPMVGFTEPAKCARDAGLSFLLLVALGACATVPMASPQEDQEAKRFDQPAPDKGAVYIYRSGWMGSARAIDVAIAGGARAELATNTYLRLEGPPGTIGIDCRYGDKTSAGQVQITDGQTRYVEVSVKVGLWTPSCEVADVSADQGRAAVLASRRVAIQ